MTIAAIPNRPQGSQTRNIQAILDDFDAIINFINGKNIDQDNVATSLMNSFLKLLTVGDRKVNFGTDNATKTNDTLFQQTVNHGLGAVPLIVLGGLKYIQDGAYFFNGTWTGASFIDATSFVANITAVNGILIPNGQISRFYWLAIA